MQKLKALSLFSGCGGMNLGFADADWDIVFSHNILENIESILRNNFPLPHKGLDAVIGKPPYKSSDTVHASLSSFVETVQYIMPRSFICELPKSFYKKETFNTQYSFMENLTSAYTIVSYLLNATDFGVSQNNARVFIIGIHKDIIDEQKMLYLKLAVWLKKYKSNPSSLRNLLLPLHPSGTDENPLTCLSPIVYAKKPVIRKTVYTSILFNGNGKPLNPNAVSTTLYPNMGSNRTPIIDDELFFGDGEDFLHNYLIRLKNGETPLTGSPPKYIRRLTINEVLRIQGFPLDYSVSGSIPQQYKNIGNATPPPLAYALALSLRKLL